VITRTLRRSLSAATAVVVTTTAGLLQTAGPAAAADVEQGVGEQTASGLSLAEILMFFVGIPLLVFAGCAALVYASAGNREPRLREGQGWWSQPEYFSGDTAEARVAATSAPAGELTTGDDKTGGSGARW
jgi:hypothetical protein